MNKYLLKCMLIMVLISSIWHFSTMPKAANAQRAQIVVGSTLDITLNNTDYAWNTTLVGNQSLINLTERVLPRVVVEYADTMFQLSVQAPQGLNDTIASRIIVEYVDYCNTKGLQIPQGLNGTIAARIIVEYADAAPITHTMIAGDLNGDGKVSLQDLVLLALAYGSKPGDLKWNLKADIDGNGVVGLTDLTRLAINYGQSYHDP